MSLSELLLGVIAARSRSFSVCIFLHTYVIVHAWPYWGVGEGAKSPYCCVCVCVRVCVCVCLWDLGFKESHCELNLRMKCITLMQL